MAFGDRLDLAALSDRLGIPLFPHQRGETKRKQRGRRSSQLELDFEQHAAERPGVRFWPHPFVLSIGGGRTFEPDGMLAESDGDTLWTWVLDIKGTWTDGDSRLKICMAADRYPIWRWAIVTRNEVTDAWQAKEVTAGQGIQRKFLKRPWL